MNCRPLSLLLLAVSLLWLVGGCGSDATSRRRRLRNQRQKQKSEVDAFDTAFNFITQMHQFDPRQSATQSTYHLNKWIAKRGTAEDWKPDPMLKRVPPTLQPLLSEKALTRKGFSTDDVFYIESCNLQAAIASWAADRGEPRMEAWIQENPDGLPSDEQDQLLVAHRLFDWIVRNIQLDQVAPPPKKEAVQPGVVTEQVRPSQRLVPGPGYTYLPRQNLMFGHGDQWQRSRLFIGLARQRGIDVVLLAADPARGEMRPWLCGVRLGKEFYLFDLELGIPIPNADGRGIATLTDARKEAPVLDQLKSGEYDYGFAAKDLERITVLVDASPEAVSLRMSTLENALTGDRRMVLTVRPSEVASAARQCAGVSNAALWTVPLDAVYFQRELDRRLEERDPSVATYAAERFIVSGVNPVVNGRRLHLRGIFQTEDDQEPSAKRLYMSFRIDNETLDKLGNDPRVQKQFGLVRSPQETDAQWTSRVVASELQFRQGKQNASFWISLVHFEMDDAEACADWLVNRIIKANDGRGSWVRSANYNLSRVHEANGDYEAARRILLTDESPQALGNRVRARLIREWREREAASGGQEADQEKADAS